MELRIEKSIQRETTIIQHSFFFIICILLSCCMLQGLSIAFALPLVVVAFSCGYSYTAIYFAAIMLSSVIIGINQLLLVMSITVVALFQAVSLFKLIHAKHMKYMIALVVVFYMIMFEFSPFTIIITSLMALVHSCIYEMLTPLFMHNSLDAYSDKRFMAISVVILLAITSLHDYNSIYMLVLIRYSLLLSIYYFSIHITIPCMFYIALILIMQNYASQDHVLAILLPSFIYYVAIPNTKIKCVSLYLMSHVFLPFFINYDLQVDSFIIISSALLFLVTPNINIIKKIRNKGISIQNTKHKVLKKANNFADLFHQLTTIFQETQTLVPASEFTKYVYDDVCSNCTSKTYCHSREERSKLVKIMHQGIKQDLTNHDIEYIKSSCLKSKDYIDKIQFFHDSYCTTRKQQQMNHYLKNDLFQEFSLLSNLFSNFSTSVEETTDQYQNLKDHLQGYQFDIEYIHKKTTNQSQYILELGITNCTRKVIIEELIPIIQDYLNDNLTILEIKKAIPYIGYHKIILVHQVSYNIEYGFQQISLDKQYCGDSYNVFGHQNIQHFILSDGMGSGKIARNESKMTIDVLSKLICNDISLERSVQTINALLRLKNKSDLFTTLDFCSIDTTSAKASFVKYGAYDSYHIRGKKILTMQCLNLPMGIVKEIPFAKYEIDLEDEDIVIMVSDGVGDKFINLLRKNRSEFQYRHGQAISSYLMDCCKAEGIHDDCTIIAIKISNNQKSP